MWESERSQGRRQPDLISDREGQPDRDLYLLSKQLCSATHTHTKWWFLQILTGAYLKFLRNAHSFIRCKVKSFGGSQSQVDMFSFAMLFTCH